MSAILDLENPANWQIRDSQFFSTAPENELPEYTSVTFTSNVIVTLVDNAEAKETWKFAGWISQRINVLVGPASIPTTVNDHRLWLHRKQLLIFPPDITIYQVTIRLPSWFKQASITIWEYQEQPNT